MKESFSGSDVAKGSHPGGYRIDKTASSPMDYYTQWQISAEGKWINPKPVCFHSLPLDGWYKADSFRD